MLWLRVKCPVAPSPGVLPFLPTPSTDKHQRSLEDSYCATQPKTVVLCPAFRQERIRKGFRRGSLAQFQPPTGWDRGPLRAPRAWPKTAHLSGLERCHLPAELRRGTQRVAPAARGARGVSFSHAATPPERTPPGMWEEDARRSPRHLQNYRASFLSFSINQRSRKLARCQRGEI